MSILERFSFFYQSLNSGAIDVRIVVPVLRKNYPLGNWGCISFLIWIVAFTMSPLCLQENWSLDSFDEVSYSQSSSLSL